MQGSPCVPACISATQDTRRRWNSQVVVSPFENLSHDFLLRNQSRRYPHTWFVLPRNPQQICACLASFLCPACVRPPRALAGASRAGQIPIMQHNPNSTMKIAENLPIRKIQHPISPNVPKWKSWDHMPHSSHVLHYTKHFFIPSIRILKNDSGTRRCIYFVPLIFECFLKMCSNFIWFLKATHIKAQTHEQPQKW